MAKITKIVEIVEEYQSQGLRLTARQLYYQFVARDLIANTPAAYKQLTALLTDARYAGLVDWDAIEDRGRVPERPSEWTSISSLVESALRAYRLPRWSNQPKYVELWVEKQALAGVLAPLAREFHVTLMVNKGYSSASAMRESAERIQTAVGWSIQDYFAIVRETKRQMDTHEWSDNQVDQYLESKIRDFRSTTKPAIIFYLGDHDPSGEDMVRDIRDRILEFSRHSIDLEVSKIALTTEQVEEYDPPPNPAKMTDPRASDYVRKHGESSWEVDALPPNVLSRLIREAFEEVIDSRALKEVIAREDADKSWLRKAMRNKAKKP
ncbi:MAG TPA: hypothetical protein VMS77_09365 [Conexivisphaerales archaeon]|nr:hypothetical protein [Conexivisphaerales archaeon]